MASDLDCEDVIYTNPFVPGPLPGGDGGHEVVKELPAVGTPGIEYVVMTDPTDCDTVQGTYLWNDECGGYVSTGGAGGGGGGSSHDTKYTFKHTEDGWEAYEDGVLVFAYSEDKKDTYTFETTDSGWVARKNGNIVFQYVDQDSNDRSDGSYQIKGELSTVLSTNITGQTTVNIANVPGLTDQKLVIGETLVYDHQGTVGVVKQYNAATGDMLIETMTTAPTTRTGIRLGSVDVKTDLPATQTAAEGKGWLTPDQGDFAYVMDDDGKIAEYFIKEVDGNGNITWEFSHYINAGDYVFDIYLANGTLIPKNTDGSVTLPNFVRTIELHDGTTLVVDANGKVTLPDCCKIKGAKLADGTILVPDADGVITIPAQDGGNNQTVIYTHEKAGRYLDSVYATLDLDVNYAANKLVQFRKVSGELAMPNPGQFTIPDGMRVEIIASLNTDGADGETQADMVFEWRDAVTGNPVAGLKQVNPFNSARKHHSGTDVWQFTNETGGDVTIGLYIVSALGGTLRADYTGVAIKEMSKVFDQVQYMVKDGESEDTPVGTVIAYFGENVPAHYVACDGAIYPLGTYPEFEAWLLDEYGDVNKFGGVAGVSFAMPDLRGEFLRGTGTDSRTYQGTGPAVGIHQDSTIFQNISSTNSASDKWIAVGTTGNGAVGYDALWNNVPHWVMAQNASYRAGNGTGVKPGYFTAHPANTGVKWCIKVERTYKVFIQNLAHSVGGTFAFPASRTTWTPVTFTPTNGDTSLIENGNVFRAPVTGYYNLTASTGWANVADGDIWMSWQKRADGAPGNSAAEINKFSLADNTGSGIYRDTLSAVVYLEEGDPVTLQIYLKAIQSGGAPKFTITLLNGQNSKTDTLWALMHPNTWATGVEQDFGDGLYGKRFTGTITNSGTTMTALNLDPTLLSTKYVMVGYGGEWDRSSMSSNPSTHDCYPINSAYSNGADKVPMNNQFCITGNNGLIFRVVNNASATTTYDFWVTYRKK